MNKTDFQIIFDKLAEAGNTDDVNAEWTIASEVTREEIEAIAELRRLSNELNPYEVMSFTTT